MSRERDDDREKGVGDDVWDELLCQSMHPFLSSRRRRRHRLWKSHAHTETWAEGLIGLAFSVEKTAGCDSHSDCMHTTAGLSTRDSRSFPSSRALHLPLLTICPFHEAVSLFVTQSELHAQNQQHEPHMHNT